MQKKIQCPVVLIHFNAEDAKGFGALEHPSHNGGITSEVMSKRRISKINDGCCFT
jgi:hypothetical protein